MSARSKSAVKRIARPSELLMGLMLTLLFVLGASITTAVTVMSFVKAMLAPGK